jgi:hypothetical protein
VSREDCIDYSVSLLDAAVLPVLLQEVHAYCPFPPQRADPFEGTLDFLGGLRLPQAKDDTCGEGGVLFRDFGKGLVEELRVGGIGQFFDEVALRVVPG